MSTGVSLRRDGRTPSESYTRESASTRFWDYWRNAFARNAGLRIDHLLLSPSLAKRLTKVVSNVVDSSQQNGMRSEIVALAIPAEPGTILIVKTASLPKLSRPRSEGRGFALPQR
jgi:hypothetical protein